MENASKVLSSDKAAREAKREAAAQQAEREALEKKSVNSQLRWTGSKKSAQLLGTDWEQKSGFKK